MNDDRLEVYLSTILDVRSDSGSTQKDSDGRNDGEALKSLRQKAEAEGVPIIRTAAERYLRTVLAIRKPARILEVGTAVAYSAIMMALAADDCHIVTIEDYAPRIEAAKKNIASFGLNERIRLIEGDANDVLADMAASGDRYDLVFLDAAKGQYINQWNDIRTLMSEDGILIADNVLQDGSVIDSRYAVKRRDRTIHGRMREFLKTVFSDEAFVCDLLPVGDGLAIAVKKTSSAS